MIDFVKNVEEYIDSFVRVQCGSIRSHPAERDHHSAHGGIGVDLIKGVSVGICSIPKGIQE